MLSQLYKVPALTSLLFPHTTNGSQSSVALLFPTELRNTGPFFGGNGVSAYLQERIRKMPEDFKLFPFCLRWSFLKTQFPRKLGYCVFTGCI